VDNLRDLFEIEAEICGRKSVEPAIGIASDHRHAVMLPIVARSRSYRFGENGEKNGSAGIMAQGNVASPMGRQQTRAIVFKACLIRRPGPGPWLPIGGAEKIAHQEYGRGNLLDARALRGDHQAFGTDDVDIGLA